MGVRPVNLNAARHELDANRSRDKKKQDAHRRRDGGGEELCFETPGLS